MKRICDLHGIGQHRVRNLAIGPRQVQRDVADAVDPPMGPVGQPGARWRGIATFHDVEELAVTDQLCRPDPVAERPEAHERGLVQPQHGHVTDAVRVIHQRGAVGDHGTVDRVPITPEIVGDLRHRAAVTADLFARPACRPVGDPAVADHDRLVDLHPRPHRTR